MKYKIVLLYLCCAGLNWAESQEVTTRVYAVSPQFFDQFKARYEGDSIEELLINAGVPAPEGTKFVLNSESDALVVRGRTQTHDFIGALVIESRGKGVKVEGLPKWLIRSHFQLGDGSAIRFNDDRTISSNDLEISRWAYRKDKGFLELRSAIGKILFTAHLQPDGSTLVLRSISESVTEIALAKD